MKTTAVASLLMAVGFLLPACGSDPGVEPTSTPAANEETNTPSTELRLIGQHELGGDGAADVWALGDVAYVGGRCFGGGVKIIDVSEPARPRLVATAADHDGTSAEDVMVIDASTPFFDGKLMAVGLQNCPQEDGGPAAGGQQGLQGLELWDVSDPEQPEPLGLLNVGPLLFGGVHELYLFQRDDRAFVLAAVPFSELFHPDGLGDLRIVEVTDPRNPVQLADWGAGKDGGLAFGASSFEELAQRLPAEVFAGVSPESMCAPPPGEEPLCRGDMPYVYGHSASASEDGTRAYVSYWDAGMIIFDISDPSRPVVVGRAEDQPDDEGNVHSAIAAPGDKLAITTDEDFVHEAGNDVHRGTGLPGVEEHTDGPARTGDRWGYARLWDISDPARPREIGRFETPDSATNRTGGLYTAHNPEVRGDLLYLSWYSDGVRVVDISDPSSPREVASFEPPSTQNPYGRDIPPLVWGVHVEGDLIFLSDMAAGLYIVEMAALQ